MILCICVVLPPVEVIVRRPARELLLSSLVALATGVLIGSVGAFALFRVLTRLWRPGASAEEKASIATKYIELPKIIMAAGWIITLGLVSSYAADFIYR